MQPFTYHCPTEVVFGPECEKQVAACVQKYGGRRVLLVYGGGSVERSGLLARVTAALQAAGLACQPFGGAKPNPTLAHAREGVRAAQAWGADFVLGIGGGSAIDTAKAIAHGAADPAADIWQYWIGAQAVQRSLPVGVILTIPAAGSETSDSAVLTNTEDGHKRGLNTPFNRPRFALLDPTLAATLPAYQVACGVTDIMMHTMDRYFGPLDNELTDALAEALLRTVIHYGPAAVRDAHDYEAMSELMWAGSLSHNGLTGLGQQGDWAVHQLGHELSGRFDLAHGASLATVWGAWARYVCDAKPARFARYARNVWGVQTADEAEAAQQGIAATEAYFAALGMPTGFGGGIGVQSEEVCRQLAHSCSFEGTRTIGALKVLTEPDIAAIYRAANH